MKIYAIYKDGALFKASYDQNVPFYSSVRGAMAAIKSQTNKKNLPYEMLDKIKYSEKDRQDYLDNKKRKFKIVEFELIEKKDIQI